MNIQDEVLATHYDIARSIWSFCEEVGGIVFGYTQPKNENIRGEADVLAESILASFYLNSPERFRSDKNRVGREILLRVRRLHDLREPRHMQDLIDFGHYMIRQCILPARETTDDHVLAKCHRLCTAYYHCAMAVIIEEQLHIDAAKRPSRAAG